MAIFGKEKKNSVLIAVNEIMNFALATRYTHLLNRKAAIGVHLSIYTSSIMQGLFLKKIIMVSNLVHTINTIL